MDANEVVQAVGRGAAAALRTNKLLLGVEEFASRNADTLKHDELWRE